MVTHGVRPVRIRQGRAGLLVGFMRCLQKNVESQKDCRHEDRSQGKHQAKDRSRCPEEYFRQARYGEEVHGTL